MLKQRWFIGSGEQNKQGTGRFCGSRVQFSRRLAFEVLEARLPLAATGVVETFPTHFGKHTELSSNLGRSVAIDGDWAVAGATSDDSSGQASGSAFIYRKTAGEWKQHSTLVPSDPSYGDNFGVSVAIESGTIVVGATRGNAYNQRPGFAYVFTLEDNVWLQKAKLAGNIEGEQGFGADVDIEASTIVVGADPTIAGNHFGIGAAHVFERVDDAWIKTARLTSTAPNGAREPGYGGTVDLDGDTLVIGASGIYSSGLQDVGAAYVYQRGDSGWTEQQRLLLPGGGVSKSFGSSVAVDGNTLVVGASEHGASYAYYHGAAYVFTRSGSTWTHTQSLLASDTSKYKLFGGSAAIEGNTLVIGAPGYRNEVAGSAYLFIRNATGAWIEVDRFAAIESQTGAMFGLSLGLDGNDILVGELYRENFYDQIGALHTFQIAEFDAEISLLGISHQRSDQVQIEYAIQGSVQDLMIRVFRSANETFDLGDLSYEVASYSNSVSSGFAAWQFNPGQFDSARPYLVAVATTSQIEFDLEDNSLSLRQLPALHAIEQLPTLADELTSIEGYDWYDTDFAIDGDRAVFGAVEVGESYGNGAAFVMERQNGSWVHTARLTASDGKSYDQFGTSVAIHGDTIVVGASLAQAAYVFQFIAGEWRETAKLAISNSTSGHNFAAAVTIADGLIAVGAPGSNTYYSNTPGSVYLFEFVASSWTQVAKIDRPANVEGFGRSLDVEGDTLLVGASGRAFVYRRQADLWQVVAAWESSQSNPSQGFGADVNLDGSQAVIGSYNRAYVYRLHDSAWEFETALGSAPWHEDAVRPSVSIDGDLVVIGNPYYGSTDAVHLFERLADGQWIEHPEIRPLAGSTANRFGSALTLVDEQLYVVATGDDNVAAGGGIRQFAISHNESDVQIYDIRQLSGQRAEVRYSAQGVSTPFQLTIYRSADESLDAGDLAHRLISQSITTSNELGKFEFDTLPYDPTRPYLIAVVTSNVGEASYHNNSAFLELLPPLFAIEQFPTLLPDETIITAAARFGADVDVDGDWAVVGAPGQLRGANLYGAAYVFKKVDGVWIEQAELHSPTGYSAQFGFAVAIDGDTIVVGAGGSVSYELGGGTAYVYQRVGSRWEMLQELKSSEARMWDGFGASVGIDDGTIFVGARPESSDYTDRESIYLFEQQGSAWSQVAALYPDANPNSRLEVFASIDNGTLAVGIPGVEDHGVVKLFERSNGIWQFSDELTAPMTFDGQQFGAAVDLDDDRLAVVSKSTTVSIFDRTPAGWRFREKFAPIASASGNTYNPVVDLDGNRLAVGVTYLTYTGAPGVLGIHLFEHVAGRWLEQQRPGHEDLTTDEVASATIALDGDSLIVGTPSRHQPARYSGAAFAFEISKVAADVNLYEMEHHSLSEVVIRYFATGLSSSAQVRVYRSQDDAFDPSDISFPVSASQIVLADGPQTFAFDPGVRNTARPYLVAVAVGSDTEHSLTNNSISVVQIAPLGTEVEPTSPMIFDPLGGATTGFGTAIDVDGDRAVVGAYYDKQLNVTKGAVHVLNRQSDGRWSLQAKLVVPGIQADSQFGLSVAIDGDLIVVGAYLDDQVGSNAGAAYVFRFDGTSWNQEAKLLGKRASDFFGYSVAIENGTIVIGAYGADYLYSSINGGAFVYELVAGVWTVMATLAGAPELSYGPFEFGRAVAVSGDYIAIGAPNLSMSGRHGVGGAAVWKRAGEGWIYDQTIMAPDTIDGRLGSELSLHGNTLVLAAPRDRASMTINYSGSIYVYERDTAVWRFQQKIVDANPQERENFGASIEVIGDTIVVQSNVESSLQMAIVKVDVYHRRSNGQWLREVEINSQMLLENEYLAGPVAFDGKTLIVRSFTGELTDGGLGGSWQFLVNRVDGVGVFSVDRPEGQVLLGDYNRNGSVDAADYNLWQDSFGRGTLRFAGADGNGDGFVDEADYEIWKANFGATLQNDGAAAVASGDLAFESDDSTSPRAFARVALAAPGNVDAFLDIDSMLFAFRSSRQLPASRPTIWNSTPISIPSYGDDLLLTLAFDRVTSSERKSDERYPVDSNGHPGDYFWRHDRHFSNRLGTENGILPFLGDLVSESSL